MRKIGIITLAASLLAAPAAAQFEAQPFPLGQALPALAVPIIEYRPPMRIEPVEKPLQSVAAGSTVFVYMMPGNSASENAALALVRTMAPLKKARPVIVVRAITPAELQKATEWIVRNEIAAPIVIDRTMELALGLGATQVPSFSATDAKGLLQIRKIRGLDRPLENGVIFLDALKAQEKGTALPRSDGERPDDIRSLIGLTAPAVKVEPAAGPAKAAVDLGKPAGKPRLVVFWLATCPHCQKEVPRVADWWRSKKGAVDLVTVTRTDSAQIRSRTSDYLDSRKLGDLPVFGMPDHGWGMWKINGVPAWAMIGTDGKVVQAQVGEDLQLMRNLDEALKKAK
jgi:hypothetical protein